MNTAYNLTLLGILTLIIAILNFIFPKFFLTFGRNWMYDYDLEPSDFAIKIAKVGALVVALVAVVMIVIGVVALANGDYDLSGLTM